jgi:uncharacterized protein affecting Mg2+/Co2+ transport
MPTNRNDLNFQQGETFQLALNIQNANNMNIDLSTYSAAMQLRQSYTNNIVVESMSTANSEIMVANLGWYAITLPASRTAAVSTNGAVGYPPKVIYVYDLTLTSNTGISTKIMYGQVNFYSQVTR